MRKALQKIRQFFPSIIEIKAGDAVNVTTLAAALLILFFTVLNRCERPREVVVKIESSEALDSFLISRYTFNQFIKNDSIRNYETEKRISRFDSLPLDSIYRNITEKHIGPK